MRRIEAALLTCLTLAPLTLVPPPVLGQSVNIDLGDPAAPKPGPPYRAAGLPGTWVKIDALQPGFDYPLVGLDGAPIAATVHQIGGTEIQDVPLGQPGDPTGFDALFMRDALITHTPVENCLFFDDLEPGRYEVTTYAWMPSNPAVLNKVRVDFNPIETLVGGAWTGGHVATRTYARHFVDVTTGFLGTHSGVPSGGDFGIGAALNGVQLRKLEAAPPLFPDRTRLTWLASLDAVAYDVVQGNLTTLVATGGDFSQATTSCLVNDTPGTVKSYGANPAPGEGQWFLVRGVTATGNATYDAPGTSQVGQRDSELAAAAGACP